MRKFRKGLTDIAVALGLLLVLPAVVAFGLRQGEDVAPGESFDPPALYLTWQRDPTSTMTVHWHTVGLQYESRIEFQEVGEDEWRAAAGHRRAMPYSDRTIHTVELTGLKPSRRYRFRFGPESKTYQFRTAPAELDGPFRFVVGGDVRHRQEWMEETNRQVSKFDPEFVAFGGDLAYADDRPDRVDRWYEFFDALKNSLTAREDRLIPILPGIGNHEVRQGYYSRHEEFDHSPEARDGIARGYFALFAFPGNPAYNVLDFGRYLSMILLDTEHTSPVAEEQAQWLEKTLRDRREVPHVFPLYHVTAYPSHRNFDGRVEQLVREHWVPLFESLGVRVAFENHDHTYKRTHPIRGGRVDAQGVVYMGDGSWGVTPRTVHPLEDTWYLAAAESVRHFLLVTLYPNQRHVIAIDSKGRLIDELYQREDEPL